VVIAGSRRQQSAIRGGRASAATATVAYWWERRLHLMVAAPLTNGTGRQMDSLSSHRFPRGCECSTRQRYMNSTAVDSSTSADTAPPAAPKQHQQHDATTLRFRPMTEADIAACAAIESEVYPRLVCEGAAGLLQHWRFCPAGATVAEVGRETSSLTDNGAATPTGWAREHSGDMPTSRLVVAGYVFCMPLRHSDCPLELEMQERSHRHRHNTSEHLSEGGRQICQATSVPPSPRQLETCTMTLYLHDLAVHPRYHGMGIGRALLQRVVEAEAPPLRSITLTAVRVPRSRLDRDARVQLVLCRSAPPVLTVYLVGCIIVVGGVHTWATGLWSLGLLVPSRICGGG
jgi:ribosomal protein S18 acetylase RimI-like enzyme